MPAGESSPSQQLVENVVMIQEDLPQNPIQDTSRMVRKLRNEAEERNPRSPGKKIIQGQYKGNWNQNGRKFQRRKNMKRRRTKEKEV